MLINYKIFPISSISMASAYGTIRAGQIVLYDQAITISNVDLGSAKFTNLSIDDRDRIRVTSQNVTQYVCHNESDTTDQLETLLSGGGTATRDASISSIILKTPNVSGRAVQQTFSYNRGTFFIITGILSSALTQSDGLRVRAGIFDNISDKSAASNEMWGEGFFYQLYGNAFSVVRRLTDSNGTQSDEIVSQINFSEDTLNGSGASGYNITLSQKQSYAILMDRIGNVTFAIIKDSSIIPCHIFYEKTQTSKLRQKRFPFRYESENISGANLTDSMIISDMISISDDVLSDEHLYKRYTSVSSSYIFGFYTKKNPLVSLRLASSMDRRISLVLKRLHMMVFDAPAILYIYYNTTLVDSNFSNAESGNVQIDRSATSFLGGKLVYSTFIDINTSQIELEPFKVYRGMTGNTPTITVAASSLSGNQRSKLLCSIDWLEERV